MRGHECTAHARKCHRYTAPCSRRRRWTSARCGCAWRPRCTARRAAPSRCRSSSPTPCPTAPWPPSSPTGHPAPLGQPAALSAPHTDYARRAQRLPSGGGVAHHPRRRPRKAQNRCRAAESHLQVNRCLSNCSRPTCVQVASPRLAASRSLLVVSTGGNSKISATLRIPPQHDATVHHVLRTPQPCLNTSHDMIRNFTPSASNIEVDFVLLT